MVGRVIAERGLNRALLARQGLLEPMAAPLGDVVSSIGALQMQYWPALGPALWSRTASLASDEPHRAHATGELLTGTLLRGTIHTVTAGQYPAYATVSVAAKLWPRPADVQPGAGVAELERELRDHAAEPRTADELCEFAESWSSRHRGALSAAELEYQRGFRWRPLLFHAWLVRAPADGRWGPKTPRAFLAAPAGDRPSLVGALDTVIRCHLRAFGPAAAEDVASWISWNITPVRKALEQTDDLVTFTDEENRMLYDLADAPRPDPDVEVPVRLLPWFDSTLLAYAPKRRTRVLPDVHRDTVWVKANGQLKPTILVDGRVAGMWSITAVRGTATITLSPLEPMTAPIRRALLAEAEGLVHFCHPDAKAHSVELADD